MATNDSTAIPERTPEPQASGSPTVGAAPLSPARLFYWSVTRELWENRYIYLVPLLVAAVFLLASGIGISHHAFASRGSGGRAPMPAAIMMQQGLHFAAFVLMGAYLIVAVIYCLGALHHERQERSILFWKSLPVSDLTTVIAKAAIPLLVLPLVTFVIIVVTQGLMLLFASAVFLATGGGVAALWSVPLLSIWAQVLYHLVSVHALYYAPFYGWLLLVSGWARRATFLWAILPIAAMMIIERLVFSTTVFSHMLLSRLAGGPVALPFPGSRHMPMLAPTLANVGAFMVSPGLWIGLAVFALFLAAAVRLRRYQGPM